MSNPEESSLERDYCAGQLSLRDLAEINGISEGAIRKRAKKLGWVRSSKSGTQTGTQVRKNGTQKEKVRTDQKTKNSVGRPSSYLAEVAEDICNLLMSGESLLDISKRPGMPAQSTIYKWLNEQAEFSEKYARARETQADYFVDEMIAIADSVVADPAAVAKAKLRIDTRKWSASKLSPRKYGEKITQEITGKNGGAIQQVVYTPEDYASAMISLEEKFDGLD